ncbi:MAG TPA: hypothetical protein VLU46_09600 [Thermoanaerobaculia bacterium]|nr:hypothetical protein [Thermoanaerobaculia bacterium]
MYDRLLEAICGVAAGGYEGVYDRIGVESAELQRNNIFAAFKRQEKADSSHEGECTIVVTEPKSTPIACRISRAFYRRVAALAGAENVRVETTCTATSNNLPATVC